MNHGMNDRNVLRIRRILAVFAQVDQAILYGSRAMGTYKVGSDVDLALRGPGLTWQLCGEIAGMFEASSIPYKVDVAAVDLLQHEGLKAHIARVGVVFFERDQWDLDQAAERAQSRAANDQGVA